MRRVFLRTLERRRTQPVRVCIARQSTAAATASESLPHAASATLPTANSPLQQYDSLVSSGTLRPDPHQRRIIQHLNSFHTQLLTYSPAPVSPSAQLSRPTLFSHLFSREPPEPGSAPPNAPKGLYLYGDVGTGKTMLMDLFFDTLPSSFTRKRRVHFHAFMIDVHKRVHAAKLAMGLIGGGGGASVGGGDGGDPIAPVARDLANEAYILCFDEFQVTDIADAMILRRLLEGLLRHGVVSVITSNRHPDKLYKNGIQRSSFIPAIDLLKTHFKVIDLDSGTDYRRIPRALSHVYYHPLTPENEAEINECFDSLTSPSSSDGNPDPVIANRPLFTFGRTIHIPLSTSRVARFTFSELCDRPLSAADYLAITNTFSTVFVTDVKKMSVSRKDGARRFITFIDACYESKTKLFISSEVPIYQVFSDDTANGEISDHMRSTMDDLGLPPEVVGASSMFTGEEEIFAFARACSRLVQMGSREWVESAGR